MLCWIWKGYYEILYITIYNSTLKSSSCSHCESTFKKNISLANIWGIGEYKDTKTQLLRRCLSYRVELRTYIHRNIALANCEIYQLTLWMNRHWDSETFRTLAENRSIRWKVSWCTLANSLGKHTWWNEFSKVWHIGSISYMYWSLLQIL